MKKLIYQDKNHEKLIQESLNIAKESLTDAIKAFEAITKKGIVIGQNLNLFISTPEAILKDFVYSQPEVQELKKTLPQSSKFIDTDSLLHASIKLPNISTVKEKLSNQLIQINNFTFDGKNIELSDKAKELVYGKNIYLTNESEIKKYETFERIVHDLNELYKNGVNVFNFFRGSSTASALLKINKENRELKLKPKGVRALIRE